MEEQSEWQRAEPRTNERAAGSTGGNVKGDDQAASLASRCRPSRFAALAAKQGAASVIDSIVADAAQADRLPKSVRAGRPGSCYSVSVHPIFPWVSSLGSDFNVDFAVFTDEQRRTGAGFNFGSPRRASLNVLRDELHGLSAFALEDGVVYHAYSCYDRGTDVLHGTWQLLDRAPQGRGDKFENWPQRHDEY